MAGESTEVSMVNEHEQIVRNVCAIWADGKDAVKEAWRIHASEDIVWWNSARGALCGRAACEAGVDAMFNMLNVVRVEVPIRNVAVGNGFVFIERSDDLYLADGTCLASVPVVGVIAFEGNTIVEWRDYCDDWMRDYRPADSQRALA
jgi:limonene-1,2-epoxide hydrolase